MKKLICLISILVLCLGICNASFAATTLSDVKGTKYEEAVESLIEVGLVNGFEDDTYRPSETVTRAQMAKMMVVALGEEDKVEDAKNKLTIFTDMKTSHWAYGYINVAKDLGIINGYTDGSFGPDETVSYAEATTMAIRALGYEVEVEKSTEMWPNNYITYAKKLDLFDSVGSFVSGNGASRGDTAILLWNMLRTGVCTAKSSTSNGIQYGPGTKMLNKYKNYIYMDDAIITDVDFDNDYENAKVKVEGAETLTLTLSDNDVLELFGRKLTLLYNTKKKELVSIVDSKKYTEKSGNITNVTTKKIYLNDTSYTLPDDDNIVLYRVEKLSDAIEATLYLSGSNVQYVLATGAKNVQVGLVTAANVEVDNEEGVKIKKLGSSSTNSYALIDEDDMPKKYSIIIYYLNSDSELGILKEIEVEDAKTISSLTSTKIKLGTTTYTYSSSDYTVVAATTSSVKSLAFKSIVKADDLVYPYEYAGKTYLIVFTDAVEDEDTKAEAYEELQNYINSVKSKENKESSYSQSTFAGFINALNNAKNIKSTDSIAKMNTALTELKDANAALKTVTSTSAEGKISAKRAELRKLINGSAATVVQNKAKYTTASYNKFDDALDDANDLLKDTTTTLTEVTNAYNALINAINKELVLLTNTSEHKGALAALNEAIARCKDVGAKENYVESTYNTYKSAYDSAITIKNNSSTKTETEIKNATSKLNSAIDRLELAIDVLKGELNALIVESIDYIELSSDYMPETFETFEKAYNEARKVIESTNLSVVKEAKTKLEDAKNNLKLIDNVLKNTVNEVESMKLEENVSNALEMPENSSNDKLNKISNIKEAVKQDLESLIAEANKLASAEGTEGDGSINIAIGNTKKVLNNEESSLKELVEAYNSLKKLVK